jgi:hypothetical protein
MFVHDIFEPVDMHLERAICFGSLTPVMIG